jgi:hypothetical protein
LNSIQIFLQTDHSLFIEQHNSCDLNILFKADFPIRFVVMP